MVDASGRSAFVRVPEKKNERKKAAVLGTAAFFVEGIKRAGPKVFVTESKIRVPGTDNPGIRLTGSLCCLRC